MNNDERQERITAVQHLISGIFSLQTALRSLAPEFRWAGLGNLLEDFGEYVAIHHYDLIKAPPGADGYDGTTKSGQTVQIKTNRVSSQLGFRGEADLLLVLGVEDDGTWNELYYGQFAPILEQTGFSERDNKRRITISKLRKIKESLN